MFKFKNPFKKKPESKERIVLASIIKELIKALRDNKITQREKISLRKKAYQILVDFNLDKK